MPRNSGPLDGYRIADFTHWQAGPSCTLLLSFLGAEVIKVESMQHIDRYRKMLVPNGGDEYAVDRSPMFQEYNAGKMSVRINLKNQNGVKLAKRLLTKCDGMVYNLRQAAMDKVGLDYASIHAINSRLVVVSISNSGSSGPEKDYYGYAPTFAALGGVSWFSGYPQMPPCEHTAWPDTVVGAWGALSFLGGLLERDRTGDGMFIDLSGREAMTWYVGDEILGYAVTGDQGGSQGNGHSVMAPHNCYPCRGEDAWVAIAVGSENEWLALRRAMGDPGWSDDPRFATAVARWSHRRELDGYISAWTREYEDRELMALLQGFGVAATASFSNAELCQDPHLATRDFFDLVEHPVTGARVMAGPPWHLSGTPAVIQGSAPLLGQHDTYVMCELLGLDTNELISFREEGAIY